MSLGEFESEISKEKIPRETEGEGERNQKTDTFRETDWGFSQVRSPDRASRFEVSFLNHVIFYYPVMIPDGYSFENIHVLVMV